MNVYNLLPGMLTTTASLGLVLLWDVDGGLTQIDKYLYVSEDYIKVRTLLYLLKIVVLNVISC